MDTATDRSFSSRPLIAVATLLLLAALPTATPMQLALISLLGVGAVSVTISAVLVGLALGSVPHRLPLSRELPQSDAARLGVAVGLFGAAAAALAGALGSPAWAQAPHVQPAGTLLPLLKAVLDPATRVLMASAVILPTLLTVDHFTSGWTSRRVPAALLLALLGFAATGVPPTVHTAAWLLTALGIAAALTVAYITVLRYDLSMVALAVGTMTAAGALARGAERSYPGALAGGLAGALVALALGWWWFAALRRARVRAVAATA